MQRNHRGGIRKELLIVLEAVQRRERAALLVWSA